MRSMPGASKAILFAILFLMLAFIPGSTVRGDTVSPGVSADPPSVRLQLVSDAFIQPVQVTYPPGDAGALFVVEKIGRIRVMRHGALLAEPFLDLRGQVSGGFEQGLLSVAFHPKYPENGLFYINYTDGRGDTFVVRYRVSHNPYTADMSTRLDVLTIDQPAANHNGGMLLFGPDDYLYIGTGDGGRAGDPWGNAQDRGSLLGKILRIDVNRGNPYAVPDDNPFADHADTRGEIWALGLRNPWRFSFDRKTGDLYIADVGQNDWEEVNVQPAASAGGENYGWNTMEGFHCFRPRTACDARGLVPPVAEYSNTGSSGCSITGGYVYRGEAIPGLAGGYLFGDYCSGRIWVMAPPDASFSNGNGKQKTRPIVELLRTDSQISSFGEDHAGEVYVTDLQAGKVYKLVPR